MSKKTKKLQGFQMVPLRLPEDLRNRIRPLAEKNHLSDADIMRLAIERGLGAVERMFETPQEQAA